MRVRVALVVLFALVYAACDQGHTEESLGTLEVVAERTANTCGLQSQEYPLRFGFNVRLLRRGQLLRWQAVGAAEATGTLDPRTGAFRIALEQQINALPPDRRRDFPGCTIQRSDVIEGTLSLVARAADGGGADGSADAQAAPSDGGGDAGADAGAADAGVMATGFQGTETIQLGAVPGGDCSELIGVGATQVTSLPCAVSYTLRATQAPRR